MNRPNMLAFAKFLERRVRLQQFDCRYYRTEDGTRGCLAAWACVYQHIREGEPLLLRRPLPRLLDMNRMEIRRTAKDFLGLTSDQALLLFNPPRQVTPREAAKAVRIFANYKATPFLWAHLPFVGWWDGLTRWNRP